MLSQQQLYPNGAPAALEGRPALPHAGTHTAAAFLPPPQLCCGATPEERAAYRLPASLESFDYLNRSGCSSIAGVDDAADFGCVKEAMSAIGITPSQQHSIFTIVAAILWLGNIKFHPLSDDAVAVAAASAEAVTNAAALLQCPEKALVGALTERHMVVGGEHITRHYNMDAALDNRDALSKALYAGLFSWLVVQVRACDGPGWVEGGGWRRAEERGRRWKDRGELGMGCLAM